MRIGNRHRGPLGSLARLWVEENPRYAELRRPGSGLIIAFFRKRPPVKVQPRNSSPVNSTM